jgi:WD40 repeat protein
MGVLWQWRHAATSESLTRRNLYTSDMNYVYQAWEDGNLQLAQELLEAHMPQAGKEDLRGFEWRYLSRLCRDESRVNFTNVNFVNTRDEWVGHHGLALAADDGMVIAASGNTLKWLDCRKQREAQSKTVGAEAITELSMAMAQPGLVAYRTDRVSVLSPTGETLLGTGLAPGLGGEPGSPGAFALSWDGALLSISGTNQSVLIFDVKTGNQIGPSFDLGDNVSSLAFSPDARYLACGTSKTKIHILKAPRLERVKVLTNNTAFVTRLVFDRSGKQLASGCNDSHIRVWSFPECALVADLTGHRGMIGDLAFSPDGRRLASGGTDHTVRLWTLANLTATTLLHGHRGAVKSVLFSRDGNRLFTGSEDRTVKVWDASPQQSTNILRHAGYTADVTFSPDGTLVAVADYASQTAVLWRVADQFCMGNVGHHSVACTDVRFSPDGKLLATVGVDPNVQIWGLPAVEKILDFPAGGDEGSIAFHPRRPILAVGCNDISFCDLQKRTRLNVLENAPTDGVRRVTFSPDGKWLVLGMDNGQVFIWDFDSGRLSYSFQEHLGAISALCFSHNGRSFASGGLDHRAVIYDVGRRRVTARLDGHRLGVRALAFAPDDKTLVSTSWDGNIRFWSVANHQVALTLAHDGGPVTSVAFSLQGNLMATSGSDRTVRLWPAAKVDDMITSKKAEADRK